MAARAVFTACLISAATATAPPPPPLPPVHGLPPSQPPLQPPPSEQWNDWPGWRTWSAVAAVSTCAIVAAITIYITFLPASLIAIDGADGAAAISLQPHFTTDRIGQVVLGKQQGEGLRKLTPRLLRPVRRDLRSGIERALDQASVTLAGEKLLFDCITMDDKLRHTLQVLKTQSINAIDDFLQSGQLHLPRLVVHLVHSLMWAEGDVLVHEIARQVGILAAALVQAKLRASIFQSPSIVRKWVGEHVEDLALKLVR
jgi:acid stress-induced BolA-like protein IbaG/YrbA